MMAFWLRFDFMVYGGLVGRRIYGAVASDDEDFVGADVEGRGDWFLITVERNLLNLVRYCLECSRRCEYYQRIWICGNGGRF
jgi:hypothetical protein